MSEPTFWIVQTEDGQFWAATCRHFKRDAVQYAERSTGKSWRWLNRQRGLRAVKVTLRPVPIMTEPQR